MPGPTPEEVLELIEAQATMAGLLDDMKQRLVERKWTEHNAEVTAAQLMIPLMLNTIANQGGAE